MKLVRKATATALVALSCAAAAGCAPSPQAYLAEPLHGSLTIAVLPLANYTTSREAPDQLGPILQVALSRRPGVRIVEPGRVEEALAKEPWVMIDRLPPDLIDALGMETGANAVLVGAVLAFGDRDTPEGPVPQVSLSLRLLESPGGRVLWSAVHSRDGADSETVFGFGRVASLERLAADTVEQIMKTFPAPRGGAAAPPASLTGKEG